MSRLYDLRRWRRRSRAFLQAHPLCVMCEAAGRVTLATVVDHKVPYRGEEELFFDETNWQSMCKTDHDAAKREQENTGRIRGCDERGVPLDPSHPWNTER